MMVSHVGYERVPVFVVQLGGRPNDAAVEVRYEHQLAASNLLVYEELPQHVTPVVLARRADRKLAFLSEE